MADAAPEAATPATPKKKNRTHKKKPRYDPSKSSPQKNQVRNPENTETEIHEPKAGMTSEPKTGTPSEAKPGMSFESKAGTSTEEKAGPSSEPKTGTSSEAKAGTSFEPKAGTSIEPKAGTSIEPKAGTPSEGDKTSTPEKKNIGQRPQSQPKKKNFIGPKKQYAKGQSGAAPQEEGAVGGSDVPQERVPVSDKRRKHLKDNYRRQELEDRRMRWYHHFMSKPNDLISMDRNKMVVLKMVKKCRSQAQFCCDVCNYYCDNLSVVNSHIHKLNHIKLLQERKDLLTLRVMPPLTEEQSTVLNNFLLHAVGTLAMDPASLESRRHVANLVAELVSTSLPGCSIRMFGSSLHGLGLRSADVNLDLQVPEGSQPPAMLQAVADLIKDSAFFMSIVENFECEFPFVSFFSRENKEKCCISLNNERAVSLATLLAKYPPLDPRLRQLASLFRLWGKLTLTDNAKDGALPSYAFYLMTIFYLQQCKNPVLPVLQNLLAEKGESESATTNRILGINMNDITPQWRTNNMECLSELWIGLLKFYTVEFDCSEYTISIDSLTLRPRKTRKIFIVDPFLPTRNVARSISCNAMFQYIMTCLVTTCRYFGTPQGKFGPLFKEIYVRADKYHPDHERLLAIHDDINSRIVDLIMRVDPYFNQNKTATSSRGRVSSAAAEPVPAASNQSNNMAINIQESVNEVMQLMRINKFRNVDNIPLAFLERNCVPARHMFREMSVSVHDAKIMVKLCSPQVLEYGFNTLNCTGGLRMPRVCSLCKAEGHLKEECPEEELPPFEILPPRSKLSLQELDRLCLLVFEKYKQSDEDLQVREEVCQELQEFIRKAHPTAKLELFGSTKNGFGLKGSDMDMCLTFEDNKNGDGLDKAGFIDILFKTLKSCEFLDNLLAIPTAKVPIVKYRHKGKQLEGDISLYNVLAMENSKLLLTYTSIDTRVRILGYMIKTFAKVCNIGDASKGSLSSYAYSLLVIFFLQNCEPPVLPVLQELTETFGPPPKNIVEGCNAYFFSDLTKLHQVWHGKDLNKQSTGELWLNLLIFYTEQFDLTNNVISIRCSGTVTKFDKLWISRGIAIEDPFDLAHNLGSALTRKMSLYIIKALINGRNHFGMPVSPADVNENIEAYYMDNAELTDGDPPNDRGCRICKSIGHKEKTCPEKNKVRQAEKKVNKKEPKEKNGNPASKTLLKNTSEDDEDEEEESDDESETENDKESSDEIEEQIPTGATRRPDKQAPMKRGMVQKPSSSTNVGDADHLDRRRSCGVRQAPPGFVMHDTVRIGPHFRSFRSSSGKPIPRPVPMSIRVRAPVMVGRPMSNRGPDAPFVSQGTNSNEPQMRIPSVVFSNSNMATEPGQMRFGIPPGQETVRPPPGFVPLGQNGQRFPSSAPFSHEQKSSSQGSWRYEGSPYIAITNPVEFVYNRHMASQPPRPSVVGNVAGPRPSVGPAFNNLRFGNSGHTDQMNWGQAPPSSTFRPSTSDRVYRTETAPIHALDSSMASMQLNSSPNSSMSSIINTAREQLRCIQQNLPLRETEPSTSSNHSVQSPYQANSP